MASYNLNSPTAIRTKPDLTNLDEWFRNEVKLLNSPFEEDILLRVAAEIDKWVKFPVHSFLLMPDCDRNEKYHQFPPEIKHVAKIQKIELDSRANGPAKASYQLAGGERPKRRGNNNGWSIHHIYSGKFPCLGKPETTHAQKLGEHFTHSAGLVAIHPIADAMADEYPCFSWYLRALAYIKFKYDPDGVFSDSDSIAA